MLVKKSIFIRNSYVLKSWKTAHDKYIELGLSEERAAEQSDKDVTRELEQGFQSLELKLNTVPCSRGDFAFTTISFGQWNLKDYAPFERKWLSKINTVMLQVRRNGHGPHHKPVVFPKLVYLYDAPQIAADQYSSELFDEAVKTSTECMYPDYLSLSSDYGTVSKLFREHGVITSPMGCRAYLSPWHDEKGRYVAIGRCNIGAVSLNIPLIIRLVQLEHPDNWRTAFWTELDERLEVIREFFKKRYDIIRHAELYHNDIAIAAVEQDIDRVTAAKAADELLTLRGVRASFVLFKHDTGVNLSARSLGEINVQLIMEKLGGGGNSTTAGGQIPDGTVDAVREQLIAAIDQYLEG